MKKIWQRIRDAFGFRKNTKYVGEYLDTANMRSSIYMAIVIAVLEIWLIARQCHKYVIPQLKGGSPFFQTVFLNTSNFWLLMSLGIVMFVYSLLYISNKKSSGRLFTMLVVACVSIVICLMIPFEFKYEAIKFTSNTNIVKAILKISLYATIFLFDTFIIVASIYKYKGGTNKALLSVIVISLFALACLIFGIMVSYGDFVSSAKFDSGEYQHKQIICFLMMSIYVGCLLVWRPYVSIGILGAIFLGFYFLLKSATGIRQFPEGDEINYITFFVSLTMISISTYAQRVEEAKKDEELELLATRDTLTGLYAYEYFTTIISRKLRDSNIKLDKWIFLFMDITSFKVFNDQKGFEEGNKFLKEVGDFLTKSFRNAIISRQSDDHYVVFCPNHNIEEILTSINEGIEHLDLDIRPGIKVGGYVLRDKNEDPHLSVEKARYACTELKDSKYGIFLKYDQEMHDNYRKIQYVVRHVDEAIENGYIRAYYQPVAWAKDKTICGAEALSRWIDPKYGFLTPNIFIGALEDSQLIYKLDLAMLRIVCRDLRFNMDNNLPVFPVSINFSRHDFVVDIVSMIDEVVNEYNIPKHMIHVEITESALTRDEDKLKAAMDRLHELGYAIWLDDFGSGYSSFNVLKDFNFDVLKLDMKFLVGFEGNEKAKTLIKSVIQLADQIGIKTLCEGVETQEQAEFLHKVHCGRLQGWLIGKPMPYEEFKEKIVSKQLTISKEIE